MSKSAAEICVALGGKRSGKEFKAKCPVHTDKSASLCIKDGESNKILLFCMAGCKFKDVAKELVRLGHMDQLEKSEPWDRKYPNEFNHPVVGKFTVWMDSPDYELVMVYPYRWADGTIYKFKARLRNGQKPKDFRWFHLTDQGWFKSGEGEGPHYPYRWPEIVAAVESGKIIHIPEGEKDADTLVEHFKFHSTTPGGVSAPIRPDALDLLAKAKGIVVWADVDASGKGQKRAADICMWLHTRQAKVKLVAAKLGKDVTDWKEAGGTTADIAELLKETQLYVPPVEQLEAAAKAGAVPKTPYDLGSQSYAGEYFAHKYKDRLKFIYPHNEWFAFNGQIWEQDIAQDHRESAKALVSHIRGSLGLFDIIQQKSLEKLAKEVQTDRGVKAVLSMARTVPAIKSNILGFDTEEHEHLFNSASGVVDLRTGKIAKHSPSYLITKCGPVQVDLDGEPEEYKAYVRNLFQGDEHVVRWLQYFMGYCLTGDSKFQHFLMWTGKEGSGKSTFMDIIRRIMGTYIASISADSIRQSHQRSASVDSDLAGTLGARVVFCPELSEKYRLDEGIIKALTGGDSVKVKFMHENKFDLRTNAKLIFTANDRPPLSGDNALFRRLIELRFQQGIVKPDRYFAQRLVHAEGAKILGYWVKGAVECYRSELECLEDIPDIAVEWTNEYKAESDIVARFKADRVGTSYGGFVSNARMFDEWIKYCKSFGFTPDISVDALGRRLTKLGLDRGKNTIDQRGYKNVCIVNDQLAI